MRQINKYIGCMLLCLLSVLTILSSCEKDINMDFKSIPSNFVIDGDVTPENIVLSISQTQDVLSETPAEAFVDAQVEIIATKDGAVDTIPLQADADGLFRPTSNVVGEIGTSYLLRATIKGETYKAASKLYDLGEVSEPYFDWVDVNSSLKMLYLRFVVKDIVDETNYYSVRIYRRGSLFGDQYIKDEEKDGDSINVNLFCTTETRMDDADYEENKNDDGYIFDNDTLIVHISSLDKAAFDYLKSVRTVASNGGDPFKMFMKASDDEKSSDILGYFSAYTEKVYTLVYHEEETY